MHFNRFRTIACAACFATACVSSGVSAATVTTTQTFAMSLSDDEDVALSISNSSPTSNSAGRIAERGTSTSKVLQGFDSSLGTLTKVTLRFTGITGSVEANEIGDSCNSPGLSSCTVDTSGTINFAFGFDLSVIPDPVVGAPTTGVPDVELRSNTIDIQGGTPIPVNQPNGSNRLKEYTSAEELGYFTDIGTLDVIARGVMYYSISLDCTWTAVIFRNERDCSGGLQGVYSNVRLSGSLSYEYEEPAPVPLPAGLPLLLIGVGGLALLRRRR